MINREFKFRNDFSASKLIKYRNFLKISFETNYAHYLDSDSEIARTLKLASENGNLEKVKALVVNGADINARDYSGETALISAIKKKRNHIAKYLIQNGADLDKELMYILLKANIVPSPRYKIFR